jgi:predicted NBD/HSP70 family sugar kinase
LLKRFHLSALANMVTAMNPDRVLLTGRVVEEAGELLVPLMKDHMLRNVPDHCRNVRLVHIGRPLNGAGIAAALVIKMTFAARLSRLSY